MSDRKILFLATEDWFLRSHFLHLIEAARAQGLKPLVAARFGEAQHDIAAAGAELCHLPALGRGLSPKGVSEEIAQLRALIADERPALVHAIALKSACLIALANPPPTTSVIYAITGLGHLGTTRSLRARAMRAVALEMIANAARKTNAIMLVENTHDQRKFTKRGVPKARVFVLPGAGIDPDAYHVAPEPAGVPVRVGLAARLVRSKGVDCAVDAVQALRARGINVTLDIAGRPDSENPASYSEAEIARWNAILGVACLGWVGNMREFWATKHIALVPSLGGEGLPRALLEAAACGRAIITTSTPGCRDFVRDGETGLLVRPNNAEQLAEAILRLSADAALRQRLAAAGRNLVEREYTTAKVQAIVATAWREAPALTAQSTRS